MERLLTVDDIMARYRCSAQTARKRMREMAHMEKPLMVTESAVAVWEMRKTVHPDEKQPRRVQKAEWKPGQRLARRAY